MTAGERIEEIIAGHELAIFCEKAVLDALKPYVEAFRGGADYGEFELRRVRQHSTSESDIRNWEKDIVALKEALAALKEPGQEGRE